MLSVVCVLLHQEVCGGPEAREVHVCHALEVSQDEELLRGGRVPLRVQQTVHQRRRRQRGVDHRHLLEVREIDSEGVARSGSAGDSDELRDDHPDRSLVLLPVRHRLELQRDVFADVGIPFQSPAPQPHEGRLVARVSSDQEHVVIRVPPITFPRALRWAGGRHALHIWADARLHRGRRVQLHSIQRGYCCCCRVPLNLLIEIMRLLRRCVSRDSDK
mmetsp:Transcript_43122/g.101408  ORF Transcript_43122/g.101408 Transcript_43122/m.101408 type:complete len:217 (-) Transcript_43122:298-948(-)